MTRKNRTVAPHATHRRTVINLLKERNLVDSRFAYVSRGTATHKYKINSPHFVRISFQNQLASEEDKIFENIIM